MTFIASGRQPVMPEGASQTAQLLIDICLEMESKERPSALFLSRHQFIGRLGADGGFQPDNLGLTTDCLHTQQVGHDAHDIRHAQFTIDSSLPERHLVKCLLLGETSAEKSSLIPYLAIVCLDGMLKYWKIFAQRRFYESTEVPTSTLGSEMDVNFTSRSSTSKWYILRAEISRKLYWVKSNVLDTTESSPWHSKS